MNFYSEKKSKRYGGKGKQNTIVTAQQDLGSDSGDEALNTTTGKKGTHYLHVNFESHEINSSTYEPLHNE